MHNMQTGLMLHVHVESEREERERVGRAEESISRQGLIITCFIPFQRRGSSSSNVEDNNMP